MTQTTPDPGDASLLSAREGAAAWQTDLTTGLSSQEAARRLARDGPNALRAAATVPGWRRRNWPASPTCLGGTRSC